MQPISDAWVARQYELDMRSEEFQDQPPERLAWYCVNCGVVPRSGVDGSDESCLQCGSHVKLERV